MSNQEVVTFSMWFPDEPNDAEDGEDYVEMRTENGTSGWNDLSGHIGTFVVCEKELPMLHSWTNVDNMKFWYSDVTLNVHDANKYCESIGGQLYEPRNWELALKVMTAGKQIGVNHFWIGMSDHKDEGV